MPYINASDREQIRPAIDSLAGQIFSPGELNYAITTLILGYMKLGGKNKNYALINEVIGVLECAKLELYRRLAAPYEDKALDRNGDICYTEVMK